MTRWPRAIERAPHSTEGLRTSRGAGVVGAALIASLSCLAAHAGPQGTLTGDEWRRMPPPARGAYVAGVVDAWQGLAVVQESLGSKDGAITVFTDLLSCVRDRGLTGDQVLGLVDRYAADHPGLLGKDMPDVVFAALTRACRR
jgi:hypothetical protein